MADDDDKRAATLTASRSTVRERAPDDPPIGATFDDAATRFEPVGELGRGGMGRVVDAIDHALARRVAIKNVLATDAEALARFEREARITACLEHPSIVPLYDAGRDATGQPYYVMRRVDGKPLDAAVREAADRIALVPNVLAACDAVAFAHARSIVHRDLKPSNVLLGPFGETLVIDWGLARVLDERAPNDVVGTPGFMAPEQARGEPVDRRADVFSLGATLFYVLAGRAAWDGDSATDVIASVAANRTPDWTRLPAGVPDDLRAIVEKAIAADPAARYPDAAALAADLRRFATGRLVAAHRYSAGDQLRRFVRRHRAAVTVGAASLAVLAAVLVVSVRRIVAERDAATLAEDSEAERADELAIEHARLLLDGNPTLAAAVAKSVARGERWPHAADLAATARTRGVPWRLPASPSTWALDTAPDGRHALSVGEDGVIRLHDLRLRETLTVAVLDHPVDRRHVTSADLLDADHVALFDGSALAVIDARTHERRTIALGSPATSSDRCGGAALWADRAGRGWRLPPDGERPVPIDVGERIARIWPAPDCGALAVAGERATWLVEGDVTTRVLDAPVHQLAWSADRRELLVATRAGKLVRIQLGGAPIATELGSGFPERLAIASGRPMILTLDGLWSLAGPSRYPPGVVPVGLGVARYERAVAGSSDGRIAVSDDTATRTLVAPAPIELVSAARDSSFVLATGRSALWVWDLDDVMPRPLARVPPADPVRAVGSHHLLVLPLVGASRWLDLRDRSEAAGPAIASTSVLAVSPAGTRAVAVAHTGAAVALRPGTREAIALGGDIAIAAFLDEQRVALASRTGRIVVRDLATGAATPRCPDRGEPRFLVANGDEVAAVYADAVARAAGDGACRVVAVDGVRGAYLDRAGRLALADRAALLVWPRDGALAPHTLLPAPIATLLVVDDRHLALDTADAGYVVDLAAPGAPRRTVQLGTLPAVARVPAWPTASGEHTGVLLVPGSDASTLVDGATGAAWSIPVGNALLAGDGEVIVVRRGDRVGSLPAPLARSQLATLAALEQLTGATAARDDTLAWP